MRKLMQLLIEQIRRAVAAGWYVCCFAEKACYCAAR